MSSIRSLIYLGLIVSVFLLINIPSSYGEEEYAPYIPGPLNGKCEACHSGSALDAYGQDFASISNHASNPQGAINAIADLDSDGDGFTNSEELTKGTFPGDPSSRPESSEVLEFPLLQLAAIGISFLAVVVVVLLYNKGYYPLNDSQKKYEVNHEKISGEEEDVTSSVKKAILKLDEDYMAGELEEDVYLDLKRRYLEKLRNR